ncbi:MAG: hypothetical protein AAFR21_13070 [Pseudomonadota bacterium]
MPLEQSESYQEPSKELVVVVGQPADVIRLEKIGQDLASTFISIRVFSTFARSPGFVRIGDVQINVVRIDEGLQYRRAVNRYVNRFRLADLWIISQITIDRRFFRKWRRALNWAARRKCLADAVVAVAGKSSTVLMFQVSSLNWTGLVTERLGNRAVAFTEVWQMPNKLRMEIIRRLGGVPLRLNQVVSTGKERPLWRAEDPKVPLTDTALAAFYFAEADGGFRGNPFLVNTFGRILYAEPFLAREYSGFGISLDDFEPVKTRNVNRLRKHKKSIDNIVINPPKNYFRNGYYAWGFKAYNEFVKEWIELVVSNTDGHHILSLHPALSDEEREACYSACGCVDSRPIDELVAEARLYVTYTSTTARLAAKFGTELIVSDCYNFMNGNWPEIPGARLTESLSSFREALRSVEVRQQKWNAFSVPRLESPEAVDLASAISVPIDNSVRSQKAAGPHKRGEVQTNDE